MGGVNNSINLINEQCFNMIINNTDNAIFVVSGCKIVFANKKMAELLGMENSKEITGLNVRKVIIDEDKNLVYEQINNVIINKGSTPFVESKVIRADGDIIEVEITSSLYIYKGKPSVMVMIRDNALKKHIQFLEKNVLENRKAIELNKMMTEFFSNISHEIKTPLNLLLGALQMLSLSDKKETRSLSESNKYLKIMKQNCYRLLRLANNLIDISKFDLGYFKLNLNNNNIVNIVEEITLSVADYAKNRGIELIFDTDVEEKYMAIDLDKIERIMLNLLSNAIKFTDEGGQILVSFLDKGDRVQISIKDNGIGIPKDKLDTIFERFGQIDRTLARNSQGSGIGLSLVKSIVDILNGSIKVFSELGNGSEFIVELSVRLVEEKHISHELLYESKVEKIHIEFADIY